MKKRTIQKMEKSTHKKQKCEKSRNEKKMKKSRHEDMEKLLNEFKRKNGIQKKKIKSFKKYQK